MRKRARRIACNWREGIGGPSHLWLVGPSPACWHVSTHLLPPLYMLTKWINNNFFANHELTTIASTLLSSMYICMPITHPSIHPSIHHDTWCTLLSLQAKTWARFAGAFPDLAATNEWNCKDDGKINQSRTRRVSSVVLCCKEREATTKQGEAHYHYSNQQQQQSE